MMAEESPRYEGPVPEPWDEAEMERLAAVDDGARADAAALWRAEAPRRLRGLLDGPGPESAEVPGDAGTG